MCGVRITLGRPISGLSSGSSGPLFGGEHVQRRAGQMAGLQCLVQRVDVDHGAARGVDQDGPATHAADGLGVHDVLGGLATRHVQRDHVGLFQQLVQRAGGARIAQRQLGFHVVEHHAHAQAFGQRADLRADIAVAHDAQRLAARFESAGRALVPMAQMHARVLFRNAAQQQDGFAQYQLGDRARVGEGALNTGMPRCMAVSRSTWLVPMQKQPTTRRSGLSDSRLASRWVRTDARHPRALQGAAQLGRRQGRGVRDDVGVASGLEDGSGAGVDVLEQDDLCHDCLGRGGECV